MYITPKRSNMDIYTHTTGYSKKDNTVIAARLECKDGVHQNVLEISEGTKNLAELRALEYALCAIKELSEHSIHVNVSSTYVYGMLQQTQTPDGMKWNNSPKKNGDTVEKVRTLLENASNFHAVLTKKDPTIEGLKKLTKASVSEGA